MAITMKNAKGEVAYTDQKEAAPVPPLTAVPDQEEAPMVPRTPMDKSLLAANLNKSTEQTVETTKTLVTALEAEQKSMTIPPEVGIKIAEAITQYAEMAADFIEDFGSQMVSTAESYNEEAKALASNIRKCADLEAARAREFTARMREAGTNIQKVRTEFEKATGVHLPEPKKD
jgi:organic radical activating enzyme